jgi:hypothetical protein
VIFGLLQNGLPPPGGRRQGIRHHTIGSAPPVFHDKMLLGNHDTGGPGNFILFTALRAWCVSVQQPWLTDGVSLD